MAKLSKRFEYKPPSGQVPGGTYLAGIVEPGMAAALGRITTAYVHVEDRLTELLSFALGLAPVTTSTAGYVTRAIQSVDQRLRLIENVLRARENAQLGPEFDRLLTEFRRIKDRRNFFVHGRWFTKQDDHTCWLQERDDHGFAFHDARLIEKSELEDLQAELWGWNSWCSTVLTEHAPVQDEASACA